MRSDKNRIISRSAGRGFSLLEVMVALIIISIGMLGIAKMQGLALSSTNASRSRALAAIEASSLAAAMQANRNFWSSTTSAPALVTIAITAGVPAITTTNGALASALTAAGSSTCAGTGMTLSCYCVTGNSCTPTAHADGMAANDLYDFGQGLATFLPNATASVTCTTADTPLDCTILIFWNENTVALTSQESAAGSSVQVSYNLYVVP